MTNHERRMPIGISITLYVEMTNLGYSSVDQYLYALKATVQKLQDANQALRAELLKYSENADAAHDEQPR